MQTETKASSASTSAEPMVDRKPMEAKQQTHTAQQAQEKCCARVYESQGWGRFHACKVKPSIQRDGNWYCKIHDPVTIQQKRDDRYAKYRAKQNSQHDRHKRQTACLAACQGIADPEKAIPALVEACKLFIRYDAENCQTGAIEWAQLKDAVQSALAKAEGRQE